MYTDRTTPGAGFRAAVFLVAVLAISVVYIASSGPALYLMATGYIHRDSYRSLYEPLSTFEPHLPSRAADFLSKYQLRWYFLSFDNDSFSHRGSAWGRGSFGGGQ